MSYPGNSTSAMTTIYDKLQLLNVSLKIHKRIRVLGGVQGVFSHPSTLVVLNGCHCFVFVLGPRYDDSEISTISKVYNFAGNVNVVEQTTDSLKDENIFEKNKYEYQNPHKINNNEQFDEQQINDEHCTCTTPLFTEKGEIFPTLPQHAHIQSICNVYDTTNNIFKKSKIQYTQKRQTYKYSNESSILVSRPLESYALTSPFTFAVRQVAQIIAPSPITSVALQQTQYRPDPAPFPRKKQDNNMIELIEGSLIPLAFAQRRCRHCSKVYKTNKQISNGSKMKENINREETLSDQTSSSSDFLTDDIEPQISAYEQLKSSSKHPHFTGSDLAAAAGIYLKHRPNDLVKCAAEFGQKISLIAQAYTPTLIIDTAPLGINQYGIVCDYEILIYTLVPNPLYKRMKKQRIRSITGNNNNSNNEFEYLPMCAVLSARIPNIQHFSFIHRCSSGVSSIFSGSNKALFQKLYHNLELLQQQKIKVNSSKGDLSKLTGQNEQVNTQQVQKIDSKQSIAEFDENIEDTLYAEDFDDANMQHLHNDNNYQQNLVNKSPKSTLQNLPSIPSFIFFSRSGSIKKAIPTFFTKIPLNNLFITLHIYSVLDQEFGDIWRGSQIEVFRDFNQVEQQTNRLVFIEQAVREYISTGRIARRPPAPLDDQMPPIYSLKNGRFIESQTLFGLSPQPISVDSTSWKNLSFQNFVKSLEHLMLYSQYLTHQRLVIRELIRRFIQQYKILKLPEGTKDEIQEKNHDIILKKSVYAISSVIGRTAFVLQSDVSDDEGLKMRRLYKQFRLGMRQLTLALKYQDKKFIKRTKEEFLDSLNREVSLKNQYWYKYRNQIFNSNIGIETNLNILFKDDPLISENIPKGQAAKPIKISKYLRRFISTETYSKTMD
ncbi:MAG: hypothetical protein EZS28_003856 [Streblomastix strix]|uniref:Uncharacterized protein n=1 Tax=Streblomastix strix TaxID=222440 RepID=A0A5J4X1T4_9EUKA|nr:MAG: hypothetical protein EZS28_003856 [Streblomastix strix]